MSEGFKICPLISRKTCWVCFATDEDDREAAWVKPCRCRGTTKWVHQLCLQRWIDEKQRGNSTADVACPQCNTKYLIIFPEIGKNPIAGWSLSILIRHQNNNFRSDWSLTNVDPNAFAFWACTRYTTHTVFVFISVSWHCRKISNISHTKCQNLNYSRPVLQLSLPDPLKAGVKLRMKMYLEQRRQAMFQLHLSDQQVHCLLRCDLY